MCLVAGVYLVPRSLPSPDVCDSGCLLSYYPLLLHHHLPRLAQVRTVKRNTHLVLSSKTSLCVMSFYNL